MGDSMFDAVNHYGGPVDRAPTLPVLVDMAALEADPRVVFKSPPCRALAIGLDVALYHGIRFERIGTSAIAHVPPPPSIDYALLERAVAYLTAGMLMPSSHRDILQVAVRAHLAAEGVSRLVLINEPPDFTAGADMQRDQVAFEVEPVDPVEIPRRLRLLSSTTGLAVPAPRRRGWWPGKSMSMLSHTANLITAAQPQALDRADLAGPQRNPRPWQPKAWRSTYDPMVGHPTHTGRGAWHGR